MSQPANCQSGGWTRNQRTALNANTGAYVRTCSGSTQYGWTNWQSYPDVPNSVFVDIDTSSCGFSSTPTYIASLAGDATNYRTTGGSSPYSTTPIGFRIYVWSLEADPLLVVLQRGQRRNMRINMVGVFTGSLLVISCQSGVYRNHHNLASSDTIRGDGRLHLQSGETLYVQPWAGDTVFGTAGGSGNVNANDFYIRSIGKWASQLNGPGSGGVMSSTPEASCSGDGGTYRRIAQEFLGCSGSRSNVRDTLLCNNGRINFSQYQVQDGCNK